MLSTRAGAGTWSVLNTRQLLLHGMLTALSCREETTSWLVLNELVLTAPWPAVCPEQAGSGLGHITGVWGGW